MVEFMKSDKNKYLEKVYFFHLKLVRTLGKIANFAHHINRDFRILIDC